MNISATSGASQVNSQGLSAAAASQEYGVAIALKVKEQIKQDGENATQLIDSASNEGSGKYLNAVA